MRKLSAGEWNPIKYMGLGINIFFLNMVINLMILFFERDAF